MTCVCGHVPEQHVRRAITFVQRSIGECEVTGCACKTFTMDRRIELEARRAAGFEEPTKATGVDADAPQYGTGLLEVAMERVFRRHVERNERMWSLFSAAEPTSTATMMGGIPAPDARAAAEEKCRVIIEDWPEAEQALLFHFLKNTGWTHESARRALERAKWWR